MRIHFEPQLRATRGKLVSGGEKGAAVHAGSFLRESKIVLDAELLGNAPELIRIFTHEAFHFVWLKLDNQTRQSWGELLRKQLKAKGELGWSAEARKQELGKSDAVKRTRKWREYLCESFCDTAAWYFSDRRRHPEFTLAAPFRKARRQWFEQLLAERQLPL